MQPALQPRLGLHESNTILSVSPIPEDHSNLQKAFHDWSADSDAHSTCELFSATTLSSAIGILRRTSCPVVICERDLPFGSWRDLVAFTQALSNPPFVIVASRHADEDLWAEALNRGAYDVVAKPFDRKEIIRILSSAYQRWHRERTPTGGNMLRHPEDPASPRPAQPDRPQRSSGRRSTA